MAMRDVLGDATTDALLGEVQGLIERLEKLGLKSPRPWGEFLGGLKAPSRKWRKEEVEERIRSNLALFRANYLIVLCGTMSCSIISNPFTMGVVLLCLACSLLLLGWRKPLDVLGRTLTPRDRLAVAGTFSFFLLLVSGALAKLSWSFAFGALLNVAHAALRRRSGPAGSGKARNEELNVSHSNRAAKDDAAIEDIESPAVVEETTEGLGSYQKEAHLRAASRTSSVAGSGAATGAAKDASPRAA